MKINNKKKNLVCGFTLIELMVATSIFVIIMLAAMSSLFVLLNAGKNSRALRFAMDNVNFSMESMTRSIRMGTNYYCVTTEGSGIPALGSTNDCVIGGGNFLAFIPQDSSVEAAYRLHTEDKNGISHSSLQRCDINDCVDIVSSDVNIDVLKFFVKGSGPSDNTQASVYIIMKGTVTVKGVPTSFAVQTMVSQRNF